MEKVITGDKPSKKEKFTFTMSADPASSTLPEGMSEMPMPNDAKEQTVQASVEGAGSVEFGILTFKQPGTYVYQIREVDGKAEGYKYDTGVYTVKYEVTSVDNKLQCVRTFIRDGAEYDKAVFTNQYRELEIIPVSTGDTNNLALYLVLFAAAAIALIFAICMLRRKNA